MTHKKLTASIICQNDTPQKGTPVYGANSNLVKDLKVKYHQRVWLQVSLFTDRLQAVLITGSGWSPPLLSHWLRIFEILKRKCYRCIAMIL